MKNILSIILLSIYSLTVVCQTDSLNSGPTPYDTKSGKIIYQFFNGIQQGQKIVIFDNYGREEKMISNTIMSLNIKNSERNAGDTIHEMIIKKAGFMYKINLDDGTGFKISRSETLPLNLDALRPGQVIAGTDVVLDRPCTIVEVFGSLRTWYWNRIPIKKEVIGTSTTKNVEEYAVFIDENYMVRKNEFDIPEGVKIK